MSDAAILVENLGKRYHIGQRLRYKTLRDTVADAIVSPVRKLSSLALRTSDGNEKEAVQDEWIWALKEVSFEIKHGEVVGIIGRNGAGKSTLLRILSRITEPTEGRAEIRGRVGSLLEVGTAFHGELTGRENIYLNGAILGMKKAEIARKFDEIVAFADVEKFIDTPVKHYSDGMYMRLAFAVAAHLEPEILLVDEVLAVGDMEFQKKCLGKMGEVAKQGRTVLFVTHNMGSLANLCPRSILLVDGHKFQDGPTGDVIGEYLALQRQDQGERVWDDVQTAPGNAKFCLRAVRIVSGGIVSGDVGIENEVNIEIEFWNWGPSANVFTGIHLADKMGVIVLASWNTASANLVTDEWSGKPHPIGLYRSVCTLPGNFLNEGRYTINVVLQTNVMHVEVVARDAVSFTVHETGAMRKEYSGPWIGVVRPRLAWRTAYLRAANGELNKEQAS